MKKMIFPILSLFSGLFFLYSCQNGSIDHIGATRLVILQPIPVIDAKFDENFKATLELLYPFECHDSVFIQDQIFLERIDLPASYKREFVIPPNLVRDFFGSNNPAKKRSLREELFYTGDSAFETNPDKPFLFEDHLSRANPSKTIVEYLSRNRKNAFVYFISNDTTLKNYEIGGITREVHNDPAKLNCRIVAELRKKSKAELINATVIIVVIPPCNTDTTAVLADKPLLLVKAGSASGKNPQRAPSRVQTGTAACPPDSLVTLINKQYSGTIREFRNLLYYIATTNKDDTLRRAFKENASREIHKIPNVRIEGIAGQDLITFLNSGFSKNIVVSPINDNCNVIVGIRISQ